MCCTHHQPLVFKGQLNQGWITFVRQYFFPVTVPWHHVRLADPVPRVVEHVRGVHDVAPGEEEGLTSGAGDVL